MRSSRHRRRRRPGVALPCGLALLVTATVAAASAPAPPGTAPAPRYGDVIDSVPVSEPLVALTFDDGPRRPETARILDILAAQGVRATFFVVGENVRRHPDLARRIVREGHAIGNHSMTHADLTRLGPRELHREIVESERVIEAATGVRPVLLRPPYGAIPSGLTGPGGLAARLRRLVVMWSLEVRDWRASAPLEVAVPTLRRMRPGAVVLLHDGGGHRGATVTATRWMVARLSREGYRLVTLPELLDAAR